MKKCKYLWIFLLSVLLFYPVTSRAIASAAQIGQKIFQASTETRGIVGEAKIDPPGERRGYFFNIAYAISDYDKEKKELDITAIKVPTLNGRILGNQLFSLKLRPKQKALIWNEGKYQIYIYFDMPTEKQIMIHQIWSK